MNIIRKIFSFAREGEQPASQVDPKSTRQVFDTLVRYSAEAISILTPELKTVYVSPGVERIFGYKIEEGTTIDITTILHHDDVYKATNLIQQVLTQAGVTIAGEQLRVRYVDGSYRWIELTLTNLSDDKMVDGILCNFRDITENVMANNKLIYASRLYNFISQINQAIVHVKSRALLFEEVCRIAVEAGGFKFAWIGLADPFSRKIPMMASSGTTQADIDYWKDYTYVPGWPIDRVLSGQPYCVLNEQQIEENASFAVYGRERGFLSAITLGIRLEGATIGALTLFSGEQHFFTEDEITLLHEAVTDLSFALEVFEKEKLRSEAEHKLKHSERRLKQSQAIAHVGSWEVNFNTGEALWSEETLRMYGMPTDHPVQSYSQWLSFIHPDDVSIVLDKISESEPTCTDCAFEHRIILRDGTVRYIYSQGQYEKDINGNPIGLYGVSHDITDAKIAEMALRHSEKSLRLIIDSIPQAISAKDRDGNFIFVNKNFAKLFNCDPTDLIEHGCPEINPSTTNLQKLLEYDDKILKTGNSRIIPEMHVVDARGIEHVFHITKLPFVRGSHIEPAVLSIAHDITEQKIADTERSHMIADIVQRNKDLEQFSYIVSHNLRAPAANIIGLTEELSTGFHTAEMNNLLIKELSASARRLDNIITDLNSILRVREIGENREIVDLRDLTESILESISHLIEQDDVDIETDYSNAPDILIVKTYLHSILYNLISNSIKYRKPEVTPIIKISSRRKTKSTEIIYEDNGLGIDLDKRGDQVFGLYKRFHQHIEGKGMGLFMVKTQVETLGGKIKLASKPGEGCKFTINFPS
jgi:PAS domain S-box-containing protein